MMANFNFDIDKAREIELMRQYNNRLREEQLFHIEQEKIDKIKINKKEKTKAKEKADKIVKYFAYDRWRYLFDRVSFCNEVPCQILFHVLLGQLLSKKRIYRSGDNFVDMRIHFIWIQQSRSGKGTAFEFVNKIARKLKNYDGDDMRVYSSGIDTTAAMIDSLVYDPRLRAYTERTRPGILSSHDLICWEEAVSLIRPYGEHNEGKLRAILDATEPYGSPKNIHTKTLQSWPISTHTICSASFIATTRPISNLRGDILYSGLFQRFLNYIRNLTSDDRKEMINKMNYSSFGNGERQSIAKEEELLVKDFHRLQEFGKTADLRPYPREKVLKYVNEKMMILLEDCWNIGNSNNRSLIESFIAGMQENLIKLACHSAIMRLSEKIELCDIEYAFEIIQKLYFQLKSWIEIDVEDLEKNSTYKTRKNIILRIISKKKKISRKDIVQYIIQQFDISHTSAYKLISRIIDESKKIIDFDGKFLIRK